MRNNLELVSGQKNGVNRPKKGVRIKLNFQWLHKKSFF
jgi:hypothetical protein